ncbi:MAG: M1 family metallopeptidase, partial [Bacteroidota bacterium]
THQLHGHVSMRYRNNSADTLRELWFHAWPRAFSQSNTAFGRQQLRAGETGFYFAEATERGTMDSLSFTIDGTLQEHTFDEDDPDVLFIRPTRPVLPGTTITIATPFRVQIPASFSRLGHVGESYQITQWYPKPAVYDRDGWHPMPYLDQGEYYAEFGRFQVDITLPENYVVGATGALQDAAERAWLLEKAKGQNDWAYDSFPPSATTFKTLRYVADDVHDFAWFADKRFRVRHDTLARPRVPGKDQEAVHVWAMYTPTEAELWNGATNYLKRSLRFYSDKIGEYPYPQMTAVQSALSAGGGMEYPMLTVIGLSGTARDLDEVLAHEVGHNWFQGVLASN